MGIRKTFNFIILMTVFVAVICRAEPSLDGRSLIKLENAGAIVFIDVGGGSIVDFHLKGHDLNPLTWNYPEKGDLLPRAMGHFICFDRWGPPSKAEEMKGIPFHGEAAKVLWEIISAPDKTKEKINAEMFCELPLGGMKLHRSLALNEKEAVLSVTEEITNLNNIGRVYNIVQHATIGPPFLDDSTVIDTNARKGFSQSGKMPFPEEPAIYWPKTVFEGRLIDLQRLSNDTGPNVTSYIFEDNIEYGWATACNAAKGLLIGYIWKTIEYPWLNIWRNVADNKPSAFGIEFGTTGLHKPFSVILEKNNIFGRNLYEYIDADEKIVKSYTVFLAGIPVDYSGVEDVLLKDGIITIVEHGKDTSRDIVINVNYSPR